MTVEIKEARPEPVIPKKQSIKIGKVAEGTAEPTIYTDSLSWHICLKAVREFRGSSLVQGHGHTVRAGIANAILQEREAIEARRKFLAEIEIECGTEGLSETEMLQRIA